MDQASEFLYYANDIYNDKNFSKEFYCDKKTDLEVGIYEDKNLTIAFRGTESTKDAMYDLMVKKVKLDCGCEVHRGFYHQLFDSSIFVEFFNKVIEISEKYETINVTGHSLGGALSILFGYHLSKNTTKKINVISFAAPRVGNWKFYRNFNNKENLKHLRVFVSTDPIPLFPFINYFHTGNKLKLKTKNVFYYVSDHHTSKYRELINELLKKRIN